MTKRRQFLVSAAAVAGLRQLSFAAPQEQTPHMYGLIAKITSVPGQRAEFIAALGASTSAMPGCISYVISEDATDPNSIWVTEVWDSKASHDASLSLPAVKDVIARTRPMIAGFAKIAETNPVAGVALPAGARH